MEGAGPKSLGTGAKFKQVPCQKNCRVNRAIDIRIQKPYRKLLFANSRGWGRLLQILSLRRGANSKRCAHLKLSANSSIYCTSGDYSGKAAVTMQQIYFFRVIRLRLIVSTLKLKFCIELITTLVQTLLFLLDCFIR